jgi:hypothetical protein
VCGNPNCRYFFRPEKEHGFKGSFVFRFGSQVTGQFFAGFCSLPVSGSIQASTESQGNNHGDGASHVQCLIELGHWLAMDNSFQDKNDAGNEFTLLPVAI